MHAASQASTLPLVGDAPGVDAAELVWAPLDAALDEAGVTPTFEGGEAPSDRPLPPSKPLPSRTHEGGAASASTPSSAASYLRHWSCYELEEQALTMLWQAQGRLDDAERLMQQKHGAAIRGRSIAQVRSDAVAALHA